MNKSNRNSLKFTWIDNHTMVFEWERKHDSVGPQKYKTRKELVISQEGKDLYFLKEGERSRLDQLCFFCEVGISHLLISDFDFPSCLLRKDCGWIKFCRDFRPGTPFGEDKKLDLGERLVIAEQIFHKIVWHECRCCEQWNKDNVVKVIVNEKEKPQNDYYSPSFLDNKTSSFLSIDNKAAFCNLLRRLPEYGYGKSCKDFRLSQKNDIKSEYEKRKRRFKDYIDCLKDIIRD